MEQNYLTTEFHSSKYDNIIYGHKSEPINRFKFSYHNYKCDISRVTKNSVKTHLGNIIFTLANTALNAYDEYTHRIRWSDSTKNIHLFVCFIVLPDQDWSQVYSEFIKFSPNINLLYPFYGLRYPFVINRFNEVFAKDRPTHMFLDLDPDNIIITKSEISSIVNYLTNIVNIQLEYIVFKNSNNDGKKHVLFTNLICNNINACLSLGKILKQEFRYVDTAQYHSNGSLRLFNAYKADKYKCIDYSVGSEIYQEPYFIQPTIRDLELINYSHEKLQTSKRIDPNIYKVTKNSLEFLGLEITIQHSGNVYNCKRIDKYAQCLVCDRVHDKDDSNFVIVCKNAFRVGCFREQGKYYTVDASNDVSEYHTNDEIFDEDLEKQALDPRRKDNRNLKEYLEKIYVPIKRFINQTIYSSPSAQMPDTINGDCLYLVSPCKTGKTNLIHGYLDKIPADKSVCFITCQRLFTTNLYNRFKDLGFISYLQDDFGKILKYAQRHNTNGDNRVLISINSLHRLNRNYDIIIIDEVETLHSCFTNYMVKLGHTNKNRESVHTFNKLIKEAELCILMDAYPQVSTIQLFEKHGKKVHVHMNDYKMHKDDTIIIVGEIAHFIDKMAQCIINKQPIVFASSLREKQKLIMEQLYIVLRDIYNFDTTKLHEHFYNSECDPGVMQVNIDNIDKSWSELDILCYTPTITCGVSYTGIHFAKVFYLGNADSGHISALQALYRVRDVSTREYYITFGRVQATKPIYSMQSNYEYFLNYNREYLDEKENKMLADTLYNDLILSSERYYQTSKERYLNNFIGQFKYNGSTIRYEYMDPEEDFDDNWDINNKTGEVFELIDKRKKEIKLKNKIDDHMKPFVNPQPLTEEDFVLVSDTDFDDLSNKANKSNKEKDITLINSFARWFPKFKHIVLESDLTTKKDMYSELKKKLSTYHKYALNHDSGRVFASNDSFDWTVRIEKNKDNQLTDSQPERRFIMKCATEVLKYLSGYDENDLTPDQDMYELLHNHKYEKIDMETLQAAFEELFYGFGQGKEEFKKRFFAIFYTNDIRKDKDFEAEYPSELNEWKKMKGILSRVLGQTYNLEAVNRNTWRQKPNISLIHNLNLF